MKRCTRENITINTFMLERNYYLMEFVNQMAKINNGRAFFAAPDKLGEYILVDYVRSRRRSSAAENRPSASLARRSLPAA